MKKKIYNVDPLTRRGFVKKTSLGLGALGMGLGSFSCNSGSKTQSEEETTENQSTTAKKKLGIALVGLGSYAEHQLGPALLETEHCYLAGIVTGTKEKEKIWQDKYGFPDKNIYNYDNYDDIANNDDIDIIYVVLPNSMHAEYTIRAAEAGKHVICEKPMAISVAECQQMIGACNKAGVKLGIGYRLHYDPYNLEMMRLGQKQVYGKVTDVEAGFGFRMGNLDQWRAKKEFSGGGPLMDVGIYAIQGSIYTLGELPTSLKAINTTKNKDAWTEVEGSLEWEMNFPSGVVAQYKSSYEENYDYLKAKAENGFFEISPAYIYNGLKGNTTDGPMEFPKVNQQALQMDAYAKNVLDDSKIIVPGEMGMRDMFLIEKIYESMSNGGQEVDLADIPQVLHKL